MNKRLILWCVPAVLWLCFTLWYTNLGGALSNEEVTEIMQELRHLQRGRMDEAQLAEFEAFFRQDTGRQFLMVNNIEMNPAPPPMPGFGEGATAVDYTNHYMEHMYPQLLARASHPVFMGSAAGAAADLIGIEGGKNWSAFVLMRYKSRRALAQVIRHPDMRDRHEYKLAAMTKTIAFPVEPRLYIGDMRLILFLLLGLAAALADLLWLARRK